jgi:YfiH family protein
VAFVRAVHGADVAWIDSAQRVPEADALITDSPNLAVVALGADCALIGIAATGVIGVVHCGWRGLVAGVVPAAIAAVQERTAGPITAILGPGICVNCFPVGTECAAAVEAACAAAVSDPSHVDLHAGVTELLVREGVEVHDHWLCTYESPLLFSHRRDALTGRHGLLVWRESERMRS